MSGYRNDNSDIPEATNLRRWIEDYRPPVSRVVGTALEAFWARAFGAMLQSELDEREQLAYEVILAYRITRCIASTRAVLFQGQPLNEITDHPIHGDPWTKGWLPDTAVPFSSSNMTHRSLYDMIRQAPYVPLSPPDTSTLLQDPNAHDHPPTEHWCFTVLKASEYLAIETNPVALAGSEYILRRDYMVTRWPDRHEILRFEEVLIEDAFKLLADHGTFPALQALERNYGFSLKEAREVISMARAVKQQEVEVNLDEERLLLLHRLDDAYRRAKAAMDLKAERNALKDMALILGLTRSEPDDIMREMTAALRQINRKGEELLDYEVRSPRTIEIPAEFRRPEPSFGPDPDKEDT